MLQHTDTLSILKKALTYHQTGKIKEAEELYNLVLKQNPKNDLALYFIGLIYSESDRFESAITSLLQAIEINPKFEYLNSIGDIYFKNSCFNETIVYYQKAIEADPSRFDVYFKIGTAYVNMQQFDKAIKMYEKSLELNPAQPVAFYNLGVVLEKTGNLEYVVKCYRKAININPNYAEAYYNLGNVLDALNKPDEAFENYLKAKELGLNIPNLYLNLGNAYLARFEYDKAVELLKKAVNLNPNYARSYNSLGIAYYRVDKMAEAEYAYKKAIEINPTYIDAYNNLGMLYRDRKEIETASEYFKKVLEIDPDNPEANFNLGTTYLLTSNYEEGWKRYEYRFYVKEDHPHLLNFSEPRWQGESLNGKTLYTYFEQGFGDTIMFSRYLPEITSMGANVVFRPQNELVELFKENTLGAEIALNPVSQPSINFDFQAPLMSLPVLLNANPNNVPFNGEKYINANITKINSYKEKYFNTNFFKVGIFWQGNPKGLKNRAIPLKILFSLFEIKDAKLYSLQKGYGFEQLANLTENYEIIDLGSTFNDFSDTAAALENLDLLISIDTSIVHLAGALGKKTWLMLPAVPEWRWMLDSNITHWYNSVHLFRQTTINNWDTVVNDVRNELIKLV